MRVTKRGGGRLRDRTVLARRSRVAESSTMVPASSVYGDTAVDDGPLLAEMYRLFGPVAL